MGGKQDIAHRLVTEFIVVNAIRVELGVVPAGLEGLDLVHEDIVEPIAGRPDVAMEAIDDSRFVSGLPARGARVRRSAEQEDLDMFLAGQPPQDLEVELKALGIGDRRRRTNDFVGRYPAKRIDLLKKVTPVPVVLVSSVVVSARSQ